MINTLLIFLSFLFNFQEPSESICISPEEEELYKIINQYRETKGQPSIPFSASLTKVAQMHAKDLEEHFDLDGADKCNPHSWSSNGPWKACCYTNDHKAASCMWDKPREIAGYESEGYEIAYFSSAGAKAEEGLSGWIESPAHHPVIINADNWERLEWQAMGVGIYGKFGVVWFGELKEESEFQVCD